jgi:sulfur-oxidizing protein SoxY
MLPSSIRPLVLAVLTIASAGPATAGSAWDELRPSIFGAKPVLDGRDLVAIKAPTRPEDLRAVPFDVETKFRDGRTVKAIHMIVDNNPAPVVAQFKFGPGRERVALQIKFRLNQQSDVRAIVEASDGQLYMTQQLVKFAGGQAACAAPPSTPPDEIAANMGKMRLADVPPAIAVSQAFPRVRLDIAHPNHTGMVLDQQTLLYTPLKMVNQLTVRQGEETVFEMEGSIGLNENPTIEFDYRQNGAGQLAVSMTDTDGAAFQKVFPIGPNS